MSTSLQPSTFAGIVALFHRISGIQLAASKQALVYGRLQRLALEAGEPSVQRYAESILKGQVSKAEMVRVVDRLTTNETYFFREPKHFEDLERRADQAGDDGFKVWSAASSSGEEAYSICMVLADTLGMKADWEVWGSDLSTAMVQAARQGLYPLDRAENIGPERLRRYCRRGQGPYDGQLLVARELRQRTQFLSANLMERLPENLPQFDVIFLRNVLIYFDADAKKKIVRSVLQHLKPEGVLYSGHAESLGGLDLPIRTLQPAIYAHG
ncbi:MAG: protein-glutamate O-methyltransferase CheR [Burkholderiales bacterium]|nr:protein-glutamate O-methyltransferase CheR [Burkholderiales bacterium]